MRWFARKPSPSDDQQREAVDEPFVADDRIVARVAELMATWNDAVRNDAVRNDSKMRAAASGISSVAGLDDLEQALVNPALLQRPWKMLAAVAHLATESGGQPSGWKNLRLCFILEYADCPTPSSSRLVRYAAR